MADDADTDALADVERQLDKMESTATNLETLSVLATRAGQNKAAKSLSDGAVDVRVQQFKLYRCKEKLVVASNSWKALTASLELVNHFIDESMSDIGEVKKVLDAVTQLVSVATKVAAAAAAL